MSTYAVHVTRGERYWVVEVPAVDRVTQARHLREVDTMARDLISIMTDTEPGSFSLDVHIDMPPGIIGHLNRAEKLREESKRAQAEAAEEVRIAARSLRNSGLPLRDIGLLLDVSYQRAGQLVNS